MLVSLHRLPVGVAGVVQSVGCRKKRPQFPVTPGATVIVKYRSPSGEVMIVECSGEMAAIRARYLKKVKVLW